MPNIGVVFKQEISRLSRREVRGEVAAMRKATAQHRRHIAALKRQVAKLERTVGLLSGKVLATPRATAGAAASTGADGKPVRFVAKGLRSLRKRLGLSADEFGRLVGVTSQSIYNWERQAATPRAAQVAVLASLRTIGKREARARLEQLGGKGRKATDKKNA